MGNEQAKAADSANAAVEDAHAQLIERLFREHNEALLRFLHTRLRFAQEARDVAQGLCTAVEPASTGGRQLSRAFCFRRPRTSRSIG